MVHNRPQAKQLVQREEPETKGQKGEIGVTGAKGQKGEIGATGAKGQKGEVGVTGAKGQKGEIGVTGAKGQKGEVGVQGIQGIDGDKGQKGQGGTNGTNGTNGTDGAKGQKGEIGVTGAKGDKGATGIQGDTGNKGDTGTVLGGVGMLDRWETAGSNSGTVNVTFTQSLRKVGEITRGLIRGDGNQMSFTEGTGPGMGFKFPKRGIYIVDATFRMRSSMGNPASHYIRAQMSNNGSNYTNIAYSTAWQPNFGIDGAGETYHTSTLRTTVEVTDVVNNRLRFEYNEGLSYSSLSGGNPYSFVYFTRAGLPGEAGPKGEPGTNGQKGEIGVTGAKGQKGEIGVTGTKGDKGATGIQGDTGNKGDTGTVLGGVGMLDGWYTSGEEDDTNNINFTQLPSTNGDATRGFVRDSDNQMGFILGSTPKTLLRGRRSWIYFPTNRTLCDTRKLQSPHSMGCSFRSLLFTSSYDEK